MERRRFHAVEAVENGESPEVVAEVVGVTPGSVRRWMRMASEPGGLTAKPKASRKPYLSQEQLVHLEELLRQGAKAFGWRDAAWTASRVREMIRREFRVAYHVEHVRKILRRRLKWTSQRARRQARERDKTKIEEWRQKVFPRVERQAYRRGASLLFWDESGFQLQPLVRRSYAPRGSPPDLEQWDRRDKVSAISVVTVSPKRTRLGLRFELLPDGENVRGPQVVAFLRYLRGRLRGPWTLFWDGAWIHTRSKVVKDYLAAHPEITVEPFPAYAPELNPDEYVWSNTKYGRMANFAPEDSQELRRTVYQELDHVSSDPDLLDGFIEHSKLPLVTAA